MVRHEWWDGGFLAWFARSPGPWFALIWVPVLLLAPVVAAASAADPLGVVWLLAIAAVHVAAVSLPYRRGGERWHAEVAVVVLTVAAAGYVALHPAEQGFLYPLMAIAMAVGVRPRVAPSLVAALTISGTIAVAVSTGSLGEALLLGFATFMAGASTFLIAFLTHTLAELDATRRRLAQVAVAEERDRFSRDLHDLLGHSLSVIVVEAEAVRRLVDTEGAAAAEHAHGIERLGREALGEVRSAVSGYRAARLAQELERAREALEVAGVRAEVAEAPRLPATVDAVLAWVVREGVTNVIRHAGARTCRIAIDADEHETTVEVRDAGGSRDGRRGAVRGDAAGSGITGLRERVEAAGGILVAEHEPDGFRLSATVPTPRDARP